jgi:GTP pyrophosphokinase
MHYGESTELGEKLLGQALRALKINAAEISAEQWDKLVRDSGSKSRQEVFADIGLGKRLAAVVARRLLASSEHPHPETKTGPIVIRGSEGMAVQFAKCCRPIPGDPIIGSIKKGQGLVIHTHDCPTAARSRLDPDKWLDVEWASDAAHMFDVGIRVVVVNQRGVLAKVAAAIAAGGSNIDNVSMDEDGSAYTNMHFTLQVSNRLHLARVMRSLRHIPEVIRIARMKD